MSWIPAPRNNTPVLTFVWREQGGPPVARPGAAGFGSALIESGIPNATVRREFLPNGLICTIELPLPESALNGGIGPA